MMKRVNGPMRSAGLLTTALCLSLAAPLSAQDLGGELTYWGGLIFSEEANNMLVAEIEAWGEANGVDVTVEMINQNETVQRVSAAVEAGTMPDALDIGLDLLVNLSAQGLFLPVDDIFARVGEAQGGWYPSVAAATDTTAVAGARTGIPFGVTGNMILRRTDLLEPAGFAAPPTTWAEAVDMAAAVTASPVSGLGFALSNVGDGNMQIAVLQSYGGRLAGDDGRTVAIDSPETRAYLGWLKDAWDRGVFPPGVATWDGGGDNQAYLSGQAAMIANTGSVGIAARNDDPELFEVTAFSALPSGPVMQVSPVGPNLRAIPATSGNPDAARALIEHLSNPDFLGQYYAVAIYGPVLVGQESLSAFDGSSLIHAGLLDLARNGTAPGFPDVYNQGFAEASSTFVIPRMAQRIVIDGWEFDAAIEEAAASLEAIYAKY